MKNRFEKTLAPAAYVRRWMVGALASLLLPALAHAGAWPEKPVRFVVPFLSGSLGDVIARTLAAQLAPALGTVVVDNRPGAGGNIGAGYVAQSAPDGYTLLLGPSNVFVTNQFLYKKVPYAALKDFDPVTVLADVPLALFVNASLPVKSVSDFAAYAKSHAGQLNYGSSGVGTPPHLAAEILNQKLGLGMTHIPYQGGPAVLTALLANDVQMYFVGLGSAGTLLSSGKLKALAVASPSRMPMLPDVPTFGEVGMGDVKLASWWALAAPAGTPAEVLKLIHDSMIAVLKTPLTKTRFDELGVTAVGDTPQQMRQRLIDETAYWSKAIPQLGVSME